MTRLALTLLLALQAATAATTLVVRVAGPLGEPLHGVAVELQRVGEPTERPKLIPRTGRDGRCRFQGLERGTYRVAMRRLPGWSLEARETLRISGREEVLERVLRPEATRAYRLSGVVENFAADRFGRPALFLQDVERAARSARSGSCLAAAIRPDGSFRVRAPRAGEYRLFIDELSSGSRGCNGLRPTPRRIVIGEGSERLRLTPPAGFER